VLVDFISADMNETDDALIILGRPFLGTSGRNIDIKGGRITFEVEGVLCYVLFYG